MNDLAKQAKAIFMSAVEKHSADQWPAFLDGACGDDVELRGRVEELLQAHVDLGSIHASAASPTANQPLSERTGAQIGPYKLLQKLGEGGMGVVFMAEQSELVERRVALKIIKPGMDTRQVIARFEAERQALALMDHPNIARVLDGGTTDSGLPFFAMELVKGIPITQYCDEHRLPLQQRLQLFVDVCHAVQHAHQKGIIHRDLKPSNVLIAEYDDQAVPKIIDFGVAKAVQQRLTEKTMFTQIGQVVGTPEYMSPEQAKLNQLDIDTRSDIYALGVLLYELLTGETPFDRQRLRSAAFDEMLRILRDEEPPRPSLRLSSSQSLPSIAANRHVEPRKLSTLIRGELDWIVMKALEKERTRRYETANGFAADVDHYLNDEPVQACPPSAAYRFRKLARRNKGPLTTATVVLLALVTVAIGAGIAAARFRTLANDNAALAAKKVERLEAEALAAAAARQAQLEAEAARNREQSLRQEAERQKEQAAVHFASARSAVDEFFQRVSENQQLKVPGLRSLRSELISSALEFYDDFARDESNASDMQRELARAFSRIARIRDELGESDEAEAANNRAIEVYEQLRTGDHDAVETTLGLARAFHQAGRYRDAATLCEELLSVEPPPVEARRLLADACDALALAARENSDFVTAFQFHQQAQAQREKLVQNDPDNLEYHAELGRTLHHVAVVLGQQGEDRQALTTFQRAVDAFQKAPQRFSWGRWHGSALQNMAARQAALGLQDEAVQSSEQALALVRKLVFQHPAVPALKADLYRAWMQLSHYQQQYGKPTAASRSSRVARQLLDNIPRDTPDDLFAMATVYGALAVPVQGSDELTDANRDDQQRYADLAMEMLSEAVDGGYRNLKALQSHTHLSALSEREDFKLLCDRLSKEINSEQLVPGEGGATTGRLAQQREAIDVLRKLVGGDSREKQHLVTLATNLHAIGEIQIGLKQFEAAEKSLQEAMEIRKRLRNQAPDDPQAAINVLAVKVSKGLLSWVKGGFPEAHQRWQACLAESLTLAEAHPNDPRAQEAIASQERKICRYYGRIGLWPLVREFFERNVRFGRGSRGRGYNEFSAAILALNARDLASRYYRECVDSLPTEKTESAQVIEYARGLAITGDLDFLSKELEERARRVYEGQRENSWVALSMAVVNYQQGQYGSAQSILEPIRFSTWSNPTYMEAAIAARVGDQKRALDRWAAANELYRDECGQSLSREVADDDKGVFNQHWWQFAFVQATRRLASEALSIETTPADPWQHLIQARGYRLIGELEKADTEMATVTSMNTDDADLQLASFRLLDEWNEAERVEAFLQKLVGQSADDPLPWIHRGRWYAEQGEHEKADADFSQAAKLTSNELDRFLQAGWWVAGPLSSDWEPNSAPSLDLNPAQPLPPTGQEGGKNALAWQSLQPDGMGRLQFLDQLAEQGTSSVLLMTYVYCTEQRVATLRSNNRADYQVWINGEPTPTVEPSISAAGLSRNFFFTPLSLHPGRNTILIRLTAASGQSQLDFRLDDHPLERAFDLARYGLLDDAAEVMFDRYDTSLGEDWNWLMSKFPVVHRNHLDVATRIVHNGKWSDDIWQAFHDSMLAEGILDTATRLRIADDVNSLEEFHKRPWMVRCLAVTYAINGRPEKALAVVVDQDGGLYLVSAARLIAYHRLGETQRARESLNQCYEILAKAITVRNASEQYLHGWPSWVAGLYVAIRDTCREIEGDTNQLDSLYDEYQTACRAVWETRGPAVSALDDLLLIAPKSEEEREALDRYLAEFGVTNQQESPPTTE